MSKKFKTPITIIGTTEEQHALIPDLENLGYKITGHYINTDCIALMSNFGMTANEIGFNQIVYNDPWIKVPASEKDLVLALAAMVDGDPLYKGELCVYIGENTGGFTIGKLYKAREDGWNEFSLFIDDTGRRNGWAPHNREKFRKATSSEILAHFNFRKYVPIAYKLIIAWPFGPGVGTILEWNPESEKYEYYEDERHLLRMDQQLIEQWKPFFEPIYKPKQIMIPYEGGNLEVIFSDGKAWCHGRSLSKGHLSALIGSQYIGDQLDVLVYAKTFTFGCNGQYKGITAESIQKVIDLL